MECIISETNRAIAAQKEATDVIVDKVQESRIETREDIASAESNIIEDNAKRTEQVEKSLVGMGDGLKQHVTSEVKQMENRMLARVKDHLDSAMKQQNQQNDREHTAPVSLNDKFLENEPTVAVSTLDDSAVSTIDSSATAETECEEKPGGFRKVFASAKKVKLPFPRMNGRE